MLLNRTHINVRLSCQLLLTSSGYVSKEALENTKIAELADRLHAALPWLKDCVKEIDVTNVVGDNYSMKGMLEYAALAQVAEKEEVDKPASMLDSIRKKGEEYQKSHQQDKKTLDNSP